MVAFRGPQAPLGAPSEESIDCSYFSIGFERSFALPSETGLGAPWLRAGSHRHRPQGPRPDAKPELDRLCSTVASGIRRAAFGRNGQALLSGALIPKSVGTPRSTAVVAVDRRGQARPEPCAPKDQAGSVSAGGLARPGAPSAVGWNLGGQRSAKP